MRFASWNVRGLNKSPHHKELNFFISMHNLDFLGILETKVKIDNVCTISKKINRSWQWLYNYDYHYNGCVWVGWNPGVCDISLHQMSAQHITCLDRFLEKDISFLVTFVYAHNDVANRVPL